MVGPCRGVPVAHLQDVLGHGVNCGVRVAHDVVEEAEGSYVECGLHRKFSEQKVQSRYGRCLA